MNMRKSLLLISLLALTPAMAAAAGNPAQGQQKSTVCQTCHGATGIAVQPIYPNLAGQHEDYLVMSLKAFRDGGRENAIMSGFAANLSDQDIEDLAAWYASQSGLVEIKDK
jgi:cytochrome c553